MRFLLLLVLAFSWPLLSPAQYLSPLAQAPVWNELDRFQETITKAEFLRLLSEVYAPKDSWRSYITVKEDAATIRAALVPPTNYTLRFAPAGRAKPAPVGWRTAAQLPPLEDPERPLAGLKIAIDPGHLGGAWAKMEERSFKIGDTLPVQEGDMTLLVTRHLRPRLEALGAQVLLVRESNTPVTPLRPADLRDLAREELVRNGQAQPRETYASMEDPGRGQTVQFQSEILFYRMSEIRHRASLVNDRLQPDLTLCLHFNAEAWGDPKHPQLVPQNHLHILVNGCYSTAELRYDDVRFEMLWKLLSRCFPEEKAASETVAEALAKAAGLPPYKYTTGNAVLVKGSRWVWARNLLANRLYHTPVVFLEPYVMNNAAVWERIQLGDYEGEAPVGGTMRRSIFREYADAVAEGLRQYYATARLRAPAPVK